MAEEDSSIVEDVLESVLTTAVTHDGPDPNAPTSTTPQSLDYGDEEDIERQYENELLEDNTAQNGNENKKDTELIHSDTAVNGKLGSIADITSLDDEISEEPEYVVEKVVEKNIGPDARVSYHVKWKNYPSSSNTWEPVENLADCDKVLQQFEIKSAEKMAESHMSEEEERTPANVNSSRKRLKFPLKEYEVNDVMGLTMVGDEKFFLVSLSNSTQKTFIRASLANRIVPQKVIDFYIKSMKWKSF